MKTRPISKCLPVGTVISGTNAGDEEAVVVIMWANVGKKGPLFIYGRPGKEGMGD